MKTKSSNVSIVIILAIVIVAVLLYSGAIEKNTEQFGGNGFSFFNWSRFIQPRTPPPPPPPPPQPINCQGIWVDTPQGRRFLVTQQPQYGGMPCPQ